MDNKESKNPMGESKSGGGNKVWLIVGLVLLGLFILAVIGAFLLYSVVKTAIEEGTDLAEQQMMMEEDSDLFDDMDIEEASETTRDAQIEIMLTQYQAVVAATAEDVSWEEYFIELDLFIDDLETLTEVDPNPLLDEALDEFRLAKQTYELAVQIDDPEAPIDEAGVALAGEQISTAQDLVNAYLDEIGY